jgi:glutathione S-transferase
MLIGLRALEEQLKSSTYVTGHAASLADVILCCDLQLAFEKVVSDSDTTVLPCHRLVRIDRNVF